MRGCFSIWRVNISHNMIEKNAKKRLVSAKSGFEQKIAELKGQCEYLSNKNANIEAEAKVCRERIDAQKSRIKSRNSGDRGIEELQKLSLIHI